jgi:hypothetical protein
LTAAVVAAFAAVVTFADDLHNLLADSSDSGPYVFVGHSTGGPYTRATGQLIVEIKEMLAVPSWL